MFGWAFVGHEHFTSPRLAAGCIVGVVGNASGSLDSGRFESGPELTV